jgi:hypothetical protein
MPNIGLAAAVAAVTRLRRAWRRAVLEDDQLLLGLRFSLNTSRPFKSAPAQHYRWQAASRQQHPALLLRVRLLLTMHHASITVAVHSYELYCSFCCLLPGADIETRQVCLV